MGRNSAIAYNRSVFIVFGSLVQLTTADVRGKILEMPFFLFYMIGTVTRFYFSTTVTANSNTFITNRATMGKVYYPHIVVPIALVAVQEWE